MSEKLLGNPQKEKAGCLALVISFLFPIVGIILYFMQENKVENRVAYLYCACANWLIGLLIGILYAVIQ